MAMAGIAEAEDVVFENVATEVGSSSAPTSVYLIEDSEAWEELWVQRHAGSDPIPPLPLVDLQQKAIIGFYAGSRPSSGYSVQINRIVKHPDRITLEVEEKVPAADCIVLTVLTSPFTFVAVDRDIGRKPIDFQLTVIPVSCETRPTNMQSTVPG